MAQNHLHSLGQSILAYKFVCIQDFSVKYDHIYLGKEYMCTKRVFFFFFFFFVVLYTQNSVH